MHPDLTEWLETRTPIAEHETGNRPLFFRLLSSEDEQAFVTLLRADPTIQVFDSLLVQLRDLLRTQHPARKLSEAELDVMLHERLRDGPLEAYGVWVYFPWKRQVVHLLDADEFTALRTNRNRNKITRDEQQQLAALSLGIVGLSVGNAVALTLTMEGAYGKLTLADFDRLDLSNMNRLRASVTDINLPKTILTARQIYEINPFAHLRLLHDGVTSDNLEQFLDGLDIVIDECDDIRVKLLLREQARTRRIPVLMETSDRGMLDVERFDLEPQRPILHGLLGACTSAEIPAELTNEQKLPFVLPIIGMERISARAAASLIEVGETISTWPQTAAEVVLGGATISRAVRRIALGEPLASGRRYVDVDGLLTAADEVQQQTFAPSSHSIPRTITSLSDEVPELIRFVVSQATLAPSGGNSQPWQFYYDGDVLWLCHDKHRSFNWIDPQQTGAYLALGAALHNLTMAAAQRGYRADCEPFPLLLRPRYPKLEVAARIRLQADNNCTPHPLFSWLSQRVTNRQTGTRVSFPVATETQWQAIAAHYGCELKLLADEETLIELGDILGEGDRLRFLCPELHQGLMSEVRWSAEEAAATGDGIDLDTMELTSIQRVVMNVLRRPEVAALLRAQSGGTRLRELGSKMVHTASAMGLLTLNGHSPAEQLLGGQAMQELWLTANSSGWAWYPLTGLMYVFGAAASNLHPLLYNQERASLENLNDKFDRIFPLEPGQMRLMLFRLTQAATPSARSLRLPVDRVLHRGRP